jgi:hypothetical protein
MSYAFQSVEALVNGVKGTTGFLSGLVSRKSGLVFVFIVLGVILSKVLFG